jgi:ABC-type transporter Mla MlaB component
MAAVKLVDQQQIKLEGELKFPVIMQARKQLENILSELNGLVHVDFSGVTGVDSSALSLWLCCLRYSQGNGTQLKALNMPDDLQGIMQLVGLEGQLS